MKKEDAEKLKKIIDFLVGDKSESKESEKSESKKAYISGSGKINLIPPNDGYFIINDQFQIGSAPPPQWDFVGSSTITGIPNEFLETKEGQEKAGEALIQKKHLDKRVEIAFKRVSDALATKEKSIQDRILAEKLKFDKHDISAEKFIEFCDSLSDEINDNSFAKIVLSYPKTYIQDKNGYFIDETIPSNSPFRINFNKGQSSFKRTLAEGKTQKLSKTIQDRQKFEKEYDLALEKYIFDFYKCGTFSKIVNIDKYKQKLKDKYSQDFTDSMVEGDIIRPASLPGELEVMTNYYFNAKKNLSSKQLKDIEFKDLLFVLKDIKTNNLIRFARWLKK